MALDAAAKKTLLRKIPHGLFICGVAEGEEVNGFTASWVTQGSFEPPLVVIAAVGVFLRIDQHGLFAEVLPDQPAFRQGDIPGRL
jgi:hypothetical protein